MFILALISVMKTYCKKNNSHCIPKAPKHDPFHLSFPPLYLGSEQRLVPMYAGCAADQLCLPLSSLIAAYSVSWFFFFNAFATFSSHWVLILISPHTSRHIVHMFHPGISGYLHSHHHRSGSLPSQLPQRTEGALTGDHSHP